MFTLFGDPALALEIVQPRLSFSKTAAVSYVRAGQALTYTLAFANHGNEPVENVVLTETYDPHTLFDSASPAPTSGDNVWQIGALPPGRSGTVTVAVRVLDDVPIGTTLRNEALLSSDGLGTQTATVHTVVGSVSFLSLILK